MTLNVYRIKPTRDGKFDLLQNEEWLQTFETEADAEEEKKHRQRFDAIRNGSDQ